MGNTDVARVATIPGTVHPHTRGEHLASVNLLTVCRGSSPHTWGTLRRSPIYHQDCRFIPTHVGNTRASRSRSTPISVHPHTRGEHVRPVDPDVDVLGSSPHTWGTRLMRSAFRGIRRFIPTHVGNTLTRSPIPGRAGVHPHTRGEHTSSARRARSAAGSSPHTWGTRAVVVGRPAALRFIPTHVGNTGR